MVESDDGSRIHMSFTYPIPSANYKTFYAKMQTADLIFNISSNSFEITKPIDMFIDGKPPAGDQKEKNWAPFIYNSTQHFVYKVFPLTVVVGTNSPSHEYTDNETMMPMKVISVDACARIPWTYGHLRGGSQAVKLPASTGGKDEYLGFFHSQYSPGEKYGGWAPFSYFIGAYTFSGTFPFKLKRMSSLPIMKPEWYDGSW
jgi:hypothetical protein